MKKKFKKLLVTLLAVTLIMTNTFVYANDADNLYNIPNLEAAALDEGATLVRSVDEDMNKIFDNLEQEIESASESDKLPVIVTFKDEFKGEFKDTFKDLFGDMKAKHEFITIPGLATELDKQEIEMLSKMDFIEQIEYDAPVYALNDNATYWFGADKAVSDFGVDGDRDGNPTSYSANDVTVAVIDTGVDASHVDLDGGKVIGWQDFVNNQSTPYDDNGHGTHCASIVAGSGDGNQNYAGVAPGAAIVGVKVLDGQGSGTMSDVTAGIDWAVANKNTYGIDVISLSLGTNSSSDGTDSTSVAVNNAAAAGIAVCVAAGNSGPAKYTIGAPGAAADAITVGAMADVGERGYNLTYFSSRGPTADNRIKPDIAAPGYNIIAAEANTGNGYIIHSGTSMATPFVAGTVALMLDANPNLTPAQVKNILNTTAKDWGPTGMDIDFGNGRLDSFEAVKTAGNFSGTNIAVPNHLYGNDSIARRGKSDYWQFQVTSTTYPVAIGMIMPNWSSSSSPNFDVYVYDSNNTQVASSVTYKRQETVNFTPSAPGTYTIKVYSRAGTGNYFLDLSADATGLTLTQNDR